MRIRLAPHEQETIVNYNEADTVADIFTYDKTWHRHFRKLGVKPTMDNGFGGMGYQVPKSWIRKPIPPRKLSGEERAMRAELARAMREKLYQKRKSLVAVH